MCRNELDQAKAVAKITIFLQLAQPETSREWGEGNSAYQQNLLCV